MKKAITAMIVLALLVTLACGCQKTSIPPQGSEPAASGSQTQESVNGTGTPSGSRPGGKEAAGSAEKAEPSDEPVEPSSGTASPVEKESQNPTVNPTEPKATEKPAVPKPTETHKHKYTAKTVAANCTTGGYVTHICSCGDSYTDSQTPALGHDYVDTVIAPTTSAGGYTEHRCSRCGDSYTDTYTDQLRWDTEEVVARICEQGNDYVRSLGLTVDPVVGSWAAPLSTSGWVPDDPEAWFLSKIKEDVDYWANHTYPRTRFNVTYGPDGRGGWYVYVMYG